MKKHKMTFEEAKKIYIKYNCSLFSMAREDLINYNLYKDLNISKTTESVWREEAINEFFHVLKKSGDIKTFNKLYDLAFTFRDNKKLNTLIEALDYVNTENETDLITMVETIIGRKMLSERSGMIFWAYDLGLEVEAKKLIQKVYIMIDFHTQNSEIQKRLEKAYEKISKIIKICRIDGI